MTVITAGSAQRPGETRLDLLQRNVAIFKEIITGVVQNNPDGLLLIATNRSTSSPTSPGRFPACPPNACSARVPSWIRPASVTCSSQHFVFDPRSVHAFIIGEHGDSEVPVWSLANIAECACRFTAIPTA